jgi:hypothetical protein
MLDKWRAEQAARESRRLADCRAIEANHPDPDCEVERKRGERLCMPGSQNYEDQLHREYEANERYWHS